jgi:hypothetical protein
MTKYRMTKYRICLNRSYSLPRFKCCLQGLGDSQVALGYGRIGQLVIPTFQFQMFCQSFLNQLPHDLEQRVGQMWHFVLCQERYTAIKVVLVVLAPHS